MCMYIMISTENNEDVIESNKPLEMLETSSNKVFDELVQVVCRQTDLNTEDARERLERENYNYMKVLNDYFEINEIVSEKKTSSTNQQIYGEIRNLMDAGAKKYRTEQEKYNKQINKQQK